MQRAMIRVSSREEITIACTPCKTSFGPHPLQELVPVHPRHHHIDDGDVEGLGAQELEGGESVGGRPDLVALALEVPREELAIEEVVVDNEDTPWAGGRFELEIGEAGTDVARVGRFFGRADGLVVLGGHDLEDGVARLEEPVGVQREVLVASRGGFALDVLDEPDECVEDAVDLVVQGFGPRLGPAVEAGEQWGLERLRGLADRREDRCQVVAPCLDRVLPQSPRRSRRYG